MEDNNGWVRYGHHVLAELERLDKGYKELSGELNKVNFQLAIIMGKAVILSIVFAGLVSAIFGYVAKTVG